MKKLFMADKNGSKFNLKVSQLNNNISHFAQIKEDFHRSEVHIRGCLDSNGTSLFKKNYGHLNDC